MKRRWLTLALIYAVAALCLVWVFHGVDLRRLGHNLVSVSWPYLLLAVLFNLSIYWANAGRWKILLRPVALVGFWRTLQAIYIGVFLNEVLPLRPGDIVRCGLLCRWTRGLRFALALSSAMIERLFEAAWLEVGFLAVVLLVPVPKSLVYACAIMTLVLFGVSLGIVVVVRHFQPDDAPQTTRLAQAWRQFVNGLRLVADARMMFSIAAMSLLALVLNVLATWALMKACGILLPLTVAAAVLIIIRAGTAIPTTPGNVGAFQFFCVLGLRLFGVDNTAAAAFTLVAFLAFAFPLMMGGAVASALAGIGLSEARLLRNSFAVKSDTANENHPPEVRKRESSQLLAR